MKQRSLGGATATLAICLALLLGAPVLAEVTPGENGIGWVRGRAGDSTTMTMTQANLAGDLEDFDDIVEGTTVSATYTFGTATNNSAYLVGIEVRSTNCADCDIAITEGAAAVGRVVFQSDGGTDPCDMKSVTVQDGAPTTYSQMISCTGINQLVTGTTGSVTVWITNNDADGGACPGTACDEDVVVWLKWESK